MDPSNIISILVAGLGATILILYKGMDRRVMGLEANSETKETADQRTNEIKDDLSEHVARDESQFQAVQATLREINAEFRESFVSLRNENNEKRTEMRNDFMNLRSESNAANARIYDLIDRNKSRRAR